MAKLYKLKNEFEIRTAVKLIKLKNSFDKDCAFGFYYNENDKLSQVMAVEQQLNIDSSELRFKNITTKDLRNAAEMFIYLNTCPYAAGPYIRNYGNAALENWFKSWSLFYNDLFKTQTVDQILLTLNRINNINITSKKMGDKVRSKILLQKILTMFLFILLTKKIESIQLLSYLSVIFEETCQNF